MSATSRPGPEQIIEILGRYVSPITAAAICRSVCGPSANPAGPVNGQLLEQLSRGLAVFCPNAKQRERCVQDLDQLIHPGRGASPPPPVEIKIEAEQDIMTARLTARIFAAKQGFDATEQSKITTAVSELARNIHRYAKTGRVSLSALEPPKAGVRIIAQDRGPGIPNLETILAGQYRSRTGLGLGILGCKRLMDEFAVDSAPERGTCITLARYNRRGA